MNPLAKIFVFVDRRNDVGMKVARKRSCKFDPFHARRRDRAQQTAEKRRAFEACQPIFSFRPIAVYVLANQMNFLVAMTTQLVDLGNDIGSSSAGFAAARERNNAVGAELITAFDDGNKRDVL